MSQSEVVPPFVTTKRRQVPAVVVVRADCHPGDAHRTVRPTAVVRTNRERRTPDRAEPDKATSVFWIDDEQAGIVTEVHTPLNSGNRRVPDRVGAARRRYGKGPEHVARSARQTGRVFVPESVQRTVLRREHTVGRPRRSDETRQ